MRPGVLQSMGLQMVGYDQRLNRAESHTELTDTYKHTLLATGTRPSSTHQWAGTSATSQEVCTSLRINMIQPRAYTRSKRSYYNPLVCRKERTDTEIYPKLDGGEIYSR